MAVPRHRMSNARKNSKRAHHAKKLKNVILCAQCGGFRLAHRMCLSCGHYKESTTTSSQEQPS